MRLVLYQPDIPQNTGTIHAGLGACLRRIGVDIIEPCGFVLDDRRLKRSAMDYIDQLGLEALAVMVRRIAPTRSCDGRLVLLTTQRVRRAHHRVLNSNRQDRLLLGRESAGRPRRPFTKRSDARINDTVEIAEARSLNVAIGRRDGCRRGSSSDGCFRARFRG